MSTRVNWIFIRFFQIHYLNAKELIMSTIVEPFTVQTLLMEEKRLLSIIQNLRNNVTAYKDIDFSSDVLDAETRLLLLRRTLAHLTQIPFDQIPVPPKPGDMTNYQDKLTSHS
jgi:hypothetical protein